MAITKVIRFTLKEPTELSDQDAASVKSIRAFLEREAAAGASIDKAFYSQFIENAEGCALFIHWDSLGKAQDFTASPDYASHVAQLAAIATTPPTALHIQFQPSPDASSSLNGPKVGTTELVFFYFPATLTDTEIATIMGQIDLLRPTLERSESLVVLDGWAADVVPNPSPTAQTGEMSKVWVNLVAWIDVDAHMRFQKSDDFLANIHHLLGIKDIKFNEMYHTKQTIKY